MTLFDLKIKELRLLGIPHTIINDTLILTEKQPNIIGCRLCYMKKPEPTQSGFKIEAGNLVNYYEKYREINTVPVEVAINCWLCPNCGRLFRELLPGFQSLEVKNVSF